MENENNNVEQTVVEENASQQIVEEQPVNPDINNTQQIEIKDIEQIQPIVQPEPKKDKKRGNKGYIVAIIALVLVVVGLFATCIFLLIKKDDGKKVTKIEVTPDPKAADYRITSNTLEDFDLYFLKLENEKTNKVYSPLSIKYALEMLAEGAEGETKTQITNILGDYEARKYVNSKNMSFANALFIKDSFKDSIKDEYKNKISSKFGAEVIIDSFKTPDNLNKWVKNKTLNLIGDLFDDVSDLDFVLVNALAIDMEWKEKFTDEEKFDHPTSAYYEHETRQGGKWTYLWLIDDALGSAKFENIEEDISALYFGGSFNRYDIISELGEDNIRQIIREDYKKYVEEDEYEEYEELFKEGKTSEKIEEVVNSYNFDNYIDELSKNYNSYAYNVDFSFYVDDDVKVFAKDLKEYNGTTLQYISIMPIKESLTSYISNTNAEKINSLIKQLKELKLENFKEGVVTEINGYIPKFNFEYNLKLLEDLKRLGISNVFDEDKSNLSGISTTPLYISDAKHKAKIELTQYGIKAAAATYLGGRGAGGSWDYFFEIPIEKIDLTFDKPYMFIIRDKSTGEVWFAGTVYEPLLWSKDTTQTDK